MVRKYQNKFTNEIVEAIQFKQGNAHKIFLWLVDDHKLKFHHMEVNGSYLKVAAGDFDIKVKRKQYLVFSKNTFVTITPNSFRSTYVLIEERSE